MWHLVMVRFICLQVHVIANVKNEKWSNAISMISYDRNDNSNFDNTYICRVLPGPPDDSFGTHHHSQHLKSGKN